MKLAWALLLAVALFGSCAKQERADPLKIRVGSYNMAVLGDTKTARGGTMDVLAKIAAGFDILAMQEVGSNGSTASDESCARAMDAFIVEADEAAGTTSPTSGGTSTPSPIARTGSSSSPRSSTTGRRASPIRPSSRISR
jgi:hypothetical protein